MRSALLIIDVQNGILRGLGAGGRQAVLDAALNETVRRLQQLQQRARAAGAPVILVQNDSEPGHRLAVDSEGWRLRDEIRPLPGEPVVRKTACDSFFETDLAEQLAKRQITHLVIGGCMTQYCVDTTCRRAVTLGYDVTLLADGHMTADSGGLTYGQIIAHHNELLDGFDAGTHVIGLAAAAEVKF
jgi:nicotinamidase-related amidase